MMMGDLIEWLRWLNFFGGLAGLAWLGVRSYMRWDEYPPAVQLFLLALSFYVFGVAYGSIEAALQNADIGARTFIYVLANSALLVSLALTQKRRHFEVHRDR